MTTQTAGQPSLYEKLLALPEGLTGEIINRQLRTQPRPAWPHGLAGSRLGADIEGPYGRGRGGPGGWWIIDEPEVHFALDVEVLVPDIAGWRKQRMPSPPEGHKIRGLARGEKFFAPTAGCVLPRLSNKQGGVKIEFSG